MRTAASLEERRRKKKMNSWKMWSGAAVAVLLAAACSGGECVQDWSLDRRSWNMGTFAAMSEMVDCGVKRLALSAALPPDEMDMVVDDAIRIAAEHNVEVYRETDFLVTDLFSPELTEGKHVLLICHESTFREYEALKADKMRLMDSGDYHGEARTEIARRFGRLLSYPEATIERQLAN
jgi:hypothetical protein